jgi:hypothetical protein
MLENLNLKNKISIYQIGQKVHKIRRSMAIHPLVMQTCIITHNIKELNDPTTIQKLWMYHENKLQPKLGHCITLRT